MHLPSRVYLFASIYIGSLTNAAAFNQPSITCDPGPGATSVQVETNSTVWPWQTFKTSSLHPPNLTITASGDPLAPGSILFTPDNRGTTPATRQSAPLIMTTTNDLVFGLDIPGTTDLRVQSINGTPYLTYWSGQKPSGANIGHGYGTTTFLDQSYNTVFVVCPELSLETNIDPPPRCQGDIHEQQAISRGTLLITAYGVVPFDLTPLNGPKNGYVLDCLIYELDIATSAILSTWSALEHVPLTSTHQPLNNQTGNGTFASAFDFFHVNAVVDVGDNLLINARHTWSIYLVDRHSGHITWTLSGDTGGDFVPLPDNGTFRWQHYARFHNVSATSADLSIFDNHNSENDNGTRPTTGLVLRLPSPFSPDPTTPVEVLRRVETVANEVFADSQGSYEPVLEGGNQLMGYGQLPIVREYGPAVDGSDLRWEARFGNAGKAVQSYRAFKQVWHATPAGWDPVLVVVERVDDESTGCGGRAYVSWNGATEVESWNIYALADGDIDVVILGSVPKRGFETVFEILGSGCFQVGAVQCGQEVRRSNVACL